MRHRYSMWGRTLVVLVCGHKPTAFSGDQGYCTKCEDWIDIDHETSCANIAQENRRIASLSPEQLARAAATALAELEQAVERGGPNGT
jgi:hypothetical protein